MKVALACAAALTTASCTNGGSPSPDDRPPETRTGGPLALGVAPGSSCIAPPAGAEDLTYGLESIGVTGEEPWEIQQIALSEPRNLELVAAYLVEGDSLIGNHSSWPPPSELLREPTIGWETRVPAVGAVLAPSTASTVTGLVLHLERLEPSRDASFGHVQVTYRAGEVGYQASSTLRFEAKSRC